MPSEDAKTMRKEDAVKKEDEVEEKSLSSMLQDRKKKSTITNGNGKQSNKVKKDKFGEDPKPISKKSSTVIVNKSIAKVKNEEPVDDDEEPTSKNNSNSKPDKQLKKKKMMRVKEEVKKTMVVAVTTVKREKKVYDLPGQKRDPPEERDSLRIFYETLYKQMPDSEMAQFWMMESGLLSKEVAKKVFEKKQKKLQKLRSPTKAIIAVKQRTTKSVTVKRKVPSSPDSAKKKKTADSKDSPKQSKKRKKVDSSGEDETDDDFVMSHKVTKKQRAV